VAFIIQFGDSINGYDFQSLDKLTDTKPERVANIFFDMGYLPNLPNPDSYLYEYINRVRSRDARVGAWMLKLTMDPTEYSATRSCIAAMIELSHLANAPQLEDLLAKVDSKLSEMNQDQIRLESRRKEWNEFLEKSKTRYTELLHDHGDTLSSQEKLAIRFKDEKLGRIESDCLTILKTAKKSAAKYEKDLQKDIVGHLPHTYWRTRSRSHMLGFFLWLVLILGASAFVAPYVYDLYVRLSPTLGEPTSFIPLLAAASLYIVAFRFVSKLCFSQYHLWTDASERTTMIKVYLAFSKHHKDTIEDHHEPILKALFRPSGTGLKDESTESPFEPIVNLINKKT
jgi:hypothetical protein